jgi:hypothetical protein
MIVFCISISSLHTLQIEDQYPLSSCIADFRNPQHDCCVQSCAWEQDSLIDFPASWVVAALHSHRQIEVSSVLRPNSDLFSHPVVHSPIKNLFVIFCCYGLLKTNKIV